ncbi:hypothetical protein TNCV_3513551 [Trichonephila clavipes]|nr:hypothetical protein TNCV_3513551 [Trichonephila clavipes]
MPIVVGSLGAWDTGNNSFLRKVATNRYLATLRKLCVSDCIRWSRDIYIQHLTGAQQYFTNASTHPNPPGTQEGTTSLEVQPTSQDSAASQTPTHTPDGVTPCVVTYSDEDVPPTSNNGSSTANTTNIDAENRVEQGDHNVATETLTNTNHVTESPRTTSTVVEV